MQTHGASRVLMGRVAAGCQVCGGSCQHLLGTTSVQLVTDLSLLDWSAQQTGASSASGKRSPCGIKLLQHCQPTVSPCSSLQIASLLLFSATFLLAMSHSIECVVQLPQGLECSNSALVLARRFMGAALERKIPLFLYVSSCPSVLESCL